MWSYLRASCTDAQLLWLTIPVLLISELPNLPFVILDLLQLKALHPYRTSYKHQLRKYPTKQELWDTFKQNLRVFAYAFLPMFVVGIGGANLVGFTPYRVDAELPSWLALGANFGLITVLSDVLFHNLHWLMHANKWLYQNFHAVHHEHNSPCALDNHYLHPAEAAIFALPAVLPALLLRSHIVVMWAFVVLAQLHAIAIHSGYHHPVLAPPTHDWHHRYQRCNYGNFFDFTDKLFGTYQHPPLTLVKE